jgi:N-methylhydantoinase A
MDRQNMGKNITLGIDVGGTFTDVLAFDHDKGTIFSAFKVPSTPQNPALGAITGVDRFLRRTGKSADVVFHGTTVGTNALIQKRASRTALITTKGFRDILALRRHARPRLYDLTPRVSPPLVPRERRIELQERIAHDGSVLVPLQPSEVTRAIESLKEASVEAVAISFLHSYANDQHEIILGDAVKEAFPDVFVSLSSAVCREFREFERTSTVTVNAYIGPTVQKYFDSLQEELQRRAIPKLFIVKSNGGVTSAANARSYPAHLIESGPAAGIIATAALGIAEDVPDLIAFDMGGTTAKVGVVLEGKPKISTEFYADRFVDGMDVGGYPIKSPVIDMIEIGSGGGSIAEFDAAGVLKVGPKSAGAHPGPACYGRGGERPTITDAHVALGHIAAEGFGSEDLEIQPELARQVIEQIAKPKRWTIERAAWGILRLANANMAEMVRLATLRRGLDPRDFSLVAFGGAGPMHAVEIAREVGVPRVIVPPYPGLFSTVGTVLGDVRHDLVQTLLRRVTELDMDEVQSAFEQLKARAELLLKAEDVGRVGEGWIYERWVDVRFEKQLFELMLPIEENEQLTRKNLDVRFRSAYRETYGYDLPDHTVELVGVRLVVRCPVWKSGWPTIPHQGNDTGQKTREREVFDADGLSSIVTVMHRSQIVPGQQLEGPLIIEDFGATIRVLEGQTVTARPSDVLIISD